jgi:hypothetical protein
VLLVRLTRYVLAALALSACGGSVERDPDEGVIDQIEDVFTPDIEARVNLDD